MQIKIKVRPMLMRLRSQAVPVTRRAAVRVVVAVEFALTLPVFLASWWLCSIYRSLRAGWAVSGLEQEPKRQALGKLMGAADADSV